MDQCISFQLEARKKLSAGLRDRSFRPAIESYLNSWFDAGMTRETQLTWVADPAWVAAAWMFKRGFKSYALANESISYAQELYHETSFTSATTEVAFLSADELRNELSPLAAQGHTAWVVDSSVRRQFEALASPNGQVGFIEADESKKTLATAWSLLDAMVSAKRIVAFGGGITSDVAGFVAAMAGVPFDAVATTILASVDAGVGGKTAVNHASGKNQIGAFHPLSRMWCAPELFGTLPPIERASGACEAIKHAWLAGMLMEGPDWQNLLNPFASKPPTAAFLRALVDVKLSLVAVDPLESGVRTLLNFGHGFGHALESAALARGRAFPHGLAVGWGMRSKLKTYLATEPVASHYVSTLDSLLQKSPAPPPAAASELETYLGQDKKAARTGSLPLVLPRHGCLNAALMNHLSADAWLKTVPTVEVAASLASQIS